MRTAFILKYYETVAKKISFSIAFYSRVAVVLISELDKYKMCDKQILKKY